MPSFAKFSRPHQASVASEDVEIVTPSGTIRTTFTTDSGERSAVQSPITPFTPDDFTVLPATSGEHPPAYASVDGQQQFLTSAVYKPATISDRKCDLIRFKGKTYTVHQIEAMRHRLRLAMEDDELPQYDTVSLAMHQVLDDFSRLVDMRKTRGAKPPTCWRTDPPVREHRISFAANLDARARAMRAELDAAHAQARVDNMMEGVAADSQMYSLMQHAVRDAIKNQAADGRHGVVPGVNMEGVLEEIFGVIEAGFLDAAGPLRLNNNLMSRNNTLMTENNTLMTENNTAMHQQVDAISQHVNAISGHVGALGGHIGSFDNNIRSVSNNVNVLGTQINVLQTVINMVPTMVQQVVEQSVKETLSQSLSQGLSKASQDVLAPLIAEKMEQAIIETASSKSGSSSPSKLKRGCILFRSRKSRAAANGKVRI